MVQRGGQDLLSKLADRGEEAISRLADAPGGGRLAEAAKVMRDRADELQRRLRGIDALEKRVAKLEKRVNELQGKKPPVAKAPAPRKRASSSASKSKASGSSGSSSRGGSSGGTRGSTGSAGSGSSDSAAS